MTLELVFRVVREVRRNPRLIIRRSRRRNEGLVCGQFCDSTNFHDFLEDWSSRSYTTLVVPSSDWVTSVAHLLVPLSGQGNLAVIGVAGSGAVGVETSSIFWLASISKLDISPSSVLDTRATVFSVMMCLVLAHLRPGVAAEVWHDVLGEGRHRLVSGWLRDWFGDQSIWLVALKHHVPRPSLSWLSAAVRVPCSCRIQGITVELKVRVVVEIGKVAPVGRVSISLAPVFGAVSFD